MEMTLEGSNSAETFPPQDGVARLHRSVTGMGAIWWDDHFCSFYFFFYFTQPQLHTMLSSIHLSSLSPTPSHLSP